MERPEPRVALIELQARDSHGPRVVDVPAWPARIGRALDNDIVLDDPHVAAYHAVLATDTDGRVVLTPLPTRNGVWLGGRRIEAAVPLPAAGAQLLLGTTRLRLRLPGEAVAPERALPRTAGIGGTTGALAAGALTLAVLLAELWIRLDPGADYSAWLPVVVGVPAAVAGWCGVWALLSKVFQHRFDFMAHLRILLPWLFALTLADAVVPQIAAALAWPTLWMLNAPLQALLGTLLVREHLAHMLPSHQRAVGVTMAAVLLAAGALTLARNERSSDSFSSEPYMSTLPMPALRLAGTVPAARLVQDMAPLAASLSERARKAADDDAAGDAAGDDD
jgi:hypothetical protein